MGQMSPKETNVNSIRTLYIGKYTSSPYAGKPTGIIQQPV
jgi:hypothetical protein